MGTKPYRLWCRKDRDGIFYLKLPGAPWESTGCKSRKAAEQFATDKVAAKRMADLSGIELPSDRTPSKGRVKLGDYARDFFTWERGESPVCPHCRRVLNSGGQIGIEHAKRMRRKLEQYLIGDEENKQDPLVEKALVDITRGDCIEYRDRLIEKLDINVADRNDPKGKRVANLALTALSTVFSEAVERGDVDSNPAARLAIKYSQKKRDIFTQAE